MTRFLLAALLMSPLALQAQANKPAAAPVAQPHPEVVLHTSQGEITIELFPDKAPKSVANFLQYVRDGFYSGTVFHRAIQGYLVQGGLYTRDLQAKRTRSAIPSEADNGLSNLRGTVAVARAADPNSGTAQFFFNLVDNRRLDFVGNQSGLTWGYAVFGKVVKGMDVVDKIAALPTRGLGPFATDVPNPMVVIDSANVVGEQAASAEPAKAATEKAPSDKPAAAPAKPEKPKT
ncbi:MAG TPA: peptidylprolyl isomerase, partial [Dyella sp.]|uniref:peptidylprolyl isomerase n=1 Tax=Dyella sp. TaxID=1869338 RepID=UPI002D780A44